jgi:hypothetical protein
VDATVALRGERFALLPMPSFIELKLASGMVAAHRGKDLFDVQELIKSASPPAALRRICILGSERSSSSCGSSRRRPTRSDSTPRHEARVRA